MSSEVKGESPAEAGIGDEFMVGPRGGMENRLCPDDRKPLRAQPQAREDAQPVWTDGVPSKHHAKEWFIAETTFGDRVVLTALPEEYAYDFKTADETYIKADRIKRWMPFPDSQYLSPHPAPVALRVAVEKLETAKVTDDPAEVFMLAMEALAVLQAEQKGGDA